MPSPASHSRAGRCLPADGPPPPFELHPRAAWTSSTGIADRWLPGQLLSAVSEGGTANVTFSHALVTATAYTVIAVAACAALFTKRDVTA